MLNIKVVKTRKELDNIWNLNKDSEFEFRKLSVTGTDLDKQIIQCIEKGKYKNKSVFTDRFGADLYLDSMSTGCKTALLVANRHNETFNCLECGKNAITCMIKYCKEGNIVIVGDEIIENIELDDNDKIDVQMDNRHFSSGEQFNDYIELER